MIGFHHLLNTPIPKNIVGGNSRLTDDGYRLYDRKGQWVIVFLMSSMGKNFKEMRFMSVLYF